MRKGIVGTAAALLCAAPLCAQEPADADARLRELERQNREILDRLKASENRNAELEAKLGAAVDERRAAKVDDSVETAVNGYANRLEDGVNWKQLTRSGNPIKFYGFFRTDLQYSSQRFNDQVNVQWVNHEGNGATPSAKSNDDEFDISVRLTRFGFDVDGGKIGDAAVTGKLEIDFANTPVKSVSGAPSGGPFTSLNRADDESRQTPRIRLAYFNVAFGDVSFRVGQDWDIISPLMPAVNADTLMWNAGNLGDRRPQVQFIWNHGDPKGTTLQWKASAGLQGAIDAADSDSNGQKDGWDAGHPMVETRFGISTPSWVDGKMLAGGGWAYWARSEADTAVFAADSHFESWALGADASVPLFGPLALRGEIFIGEALADMRGGIGQSFGRNEVSTWGGWSELEGKFDALTLAIGMSLDNPSDGDLSTSSPETRRVKNWSGYFGAKYDFGGGFKVGADVIFWETQYLDGGIGNAVRVDVYGIFEF